MPILTRFSIVLLVLLHASSLTAQDSDDFGRRSGHPYLLYTDLNVARLKGRVQSEPIVAEAWQRILASADAALENPRDDGGQGRESRRGGRRGRRGGATDERKTLSHNLAENGFLPVLDDWVWRVRGASDEWLRYAGSALENKPANFDSDGAFYESVGYTDLAVRAYLPFMLSWNTAFTEQLPESPITSQIGEWFINTLYPSSNRPMAVDFGDSSLRANGSRSVTLLWDVGYRKPRYLWYLSQFNPDIDNGLLSDTPRDLLFAPTPAEIAAIPSQPDLPTAKLYGDLGWTVTRDSWERDATMLALKSGVTWNHAHADAGTFILFHQGKDLISENGHSGYGTEEYDGYFRQSVAHNVMMFNGKAENPEDTYFGSKFPGTMSHLLDAGDLRYVLADATGPTSNNFIRNYRSFLWVGDAILVIDDVKSFEPGLFEFLLHPNAEATATRTTGLDLRISLEDSSVVVRPLFPETFPSGGLPTDYPKKMRLVKKQGFKSDRSPATYYAIAPADLSRRTKFITAILPVNEGVALPQIERLRGIEHIGVRIRQNGMVTDIYINLEADGSVRHRNANLEMPNGWETDAYLFAFTYPEGADPNDPDAITRTMVIDGSYLRREGKLVLDSLSKVYLTMRLQGDDLDVLLQGQPVINALLRVAKTPTTTRLNHRPAELPYDSKRQVITVRIEQPKSKADTLLHPRQN